MNPPEIFIGEEIPIKNKFEKEKETLLEKRSGIESNEDMQKLTNKLNLIELKKKSRIDNLRIKTGELIGAYIESRIGCDFWFAEGEIYKRANRTSNARKIVQLVKTPRVDQPQWPWWLCLPARPSHARAQSRESNHRWRP